MSEATTNTLLLNILTEIGDIKGDIGGIKEQLKNGSEKHKEFTEQLNMIYRRTDDIEDKVLSVETVLRPEEGQTVVERIQKLELFHGKIVMVLSTATLIVYGAVWVVWNGLQWLWANWSIVRDAFRGSGNH